MDLLSQVKALPHHTGAKVRRRWADYVEPYFVLINEKGYTNVGACRKLGELAGLTEREVELLHRASKGWIGRKKTKDMLPENLL